MTPAFFRRMVVRGLLAPGLLLAAAGPGLAAVELPREPEELVAMIQKGIETKDYEVFNELIFWKDAGNIKKRIVRFEINRSLGRPIESITFEDYPPDGLDGAIATGKLMPNMQVTNKVRVVYDEEPLAATGKKPTFVFLVGKRDDVYRIGLVNRKLDADDDD